MKSSIDMLPQTFLEFLLDERAIERKYRFTRMLLRNIANDI